MQIEGTKVVSVSYELRLPSEPDQILDQADASSPLTFLSGLGQLIPGFEHNLQGLKAGDSFDFQLAPEEAYGQNDPQKVIEVPTSMFLQDGKVAPGVAPGVRIMLQDQNGNPMEALVVELGDENTKLDLNPRLAGETLHFAGKVVDVRDASQEELDHGHVHGPGGHQH